MSRSERVSASVVSLVLVLVSLAAGPVVADENDVLEYCLDNPGACAVSVEAIDEGWERHWNADRPQALASTFKVAVLLAYAQAVADGTVSPDDTVDKDEWGRYFSGGGTLATSWDQMGNPDRVRIDDLARLMITNSDNSAPDLLLATLKKKLFKKAVKRFDWHDSPVALSAMFGLWQNLNGVGGTGDRIVADYGGFEAAGYQKELKKHTKALKKDSFVATVRENLCAQPPWVAGTPPCNPAQPGTSNESFEELENRYFTRSTTRSYASLMRELLSRSLLSAAAQEVVERNLDDAWFDLFPTLSPAFSRYGLKGGNLPTADGNQILTWAHYMQTSAGRFVVVVFLQDMVNTRRAPEAGDVNAFAQQFALNSSFRQQVRDAFSGGELPPELAPQLKKVSLKKKQSLTIKAKVFNTSPVASGSPVEVSLYILDDVDTGGATAVKTVQVGSIGPYKSKTANLKYEADEDIRGKLAVVMIDSGEVVSEQDEGNNLTWERLD